MKKVIILSLVMTLVLGLGAVFAGKGNQAPPGKHFNLNIIGVPHELNDNFTGGNGSRIFILRTGTTSFYVHGEDGGSYQVLDHDGTDGKVGDGRLEPGIIFPYDEDTGRWQVNIWVRLVGPKDPGNTLDIETSYFDGADWAHWASINLTKNPKFVMHGRELLADGYQDMLWEMEPGTKFRICQMRIYLVER